MVPVIVILTVAVFIVVDVVTRLVMKRLEEKRLLRERQEALDIGLRLESTDQADSLKRVEVESPKARILAVDDEAIVLDSFRKILVLAGYSIDTVESGPEAVGLVQRHDYDFVFTDLKMPDYDGLEVTKAVKHLRPDISVVIITGYGTIESAVAAMKYGAMDYVEKPFTEDELVAFVNRLVIRRSAQLAEEVPAKLHLLTARSHRSEEPNVVDVASGVFVTPEHSWLTLETTGGLRIGVDDLCVKLLKQIDGVDLPEPAHKAEMGRPLFSLRSGGRTLIFTSPVDGVVSRVNQRLTDSPGLLQRQPYRLGWICCVEAEGDIAQMRLWMPGREALSWYEGELESFNVALARLRAAHEEGEAPQEAPESLEQDLRWDAFEHTFLNGREEQNADARA